ncbi:hypothetical protein GCM10010971_24060 [Silvimonas amylolytica]|uniref:Uncharacterized protein n=2 Tax=Silvimonas amylolytica TaxID=449663 RepID=A0ABQ2PNK0_9NEIS|nr:hypothetical protein GCM10010971_24060 [Silvimonas amylolytica]
MPQAQVAQKSSDCIGEHIMDKLANITFVVVTLAGVVGAAQVADGLTRFTVGAQAGEHTVSTLTAHTPEM